MSVETTEEDNKVAQLQQQYEAASRQKEECHAVLTETNELIHHLQKEKEALMIKSKKRQADEEEQWDRFQSQYDAALKEKHQCESTFTIYDTAVTTLETEKEQLMELATNKETEVQMTQWQTKYDDAIKEKDTAEFHLHKEKERLADLREIQSAYLKKREEEETSMWDEFQERYDVALEDKKDCETALTIKEEEMMRLQEEKLAELKEYDTSSVNLSLSDRDGQDVNGGGGGDVSLITDPSATMTNSAIAEILDMHQNQQLQHHHHHPGGSIDDGKKGDVSTITESQHNTTVNNGDDDDGLDETHHDHMMAYDDGGDDDDDDDDDNTSLGATTIASSVSRAMEYKRDLAALDKFLPISGDESSVMSGRSGRSTRSVSSRSVRRRDVIKPVALLLDEKNNNNNKTDGMLVAKIDDTAEEKPLSPWALSNHGGEVSGNDVVEQSNPQCDQQLALVLHDPKQRTPRPTNLEPEEGRAALQLGNDPPGETPTERPYIDPNDDAMNDLSSVSYVGGGGRFRNVQWVDPKNIRDEDIDFGILKAYERMAGRGIVNDRLPANSVKQQQRMMDPPEDLPKNNYHPAEDDSSNSSKARLTKASLLRDNTRIRIATISSGYKKANYFVREDLDTRIYFHELEDAINYMSRRGYARMEKEDERDWIKLLGRAHNVVKVGPTKKKQRYRKGKLVMILSKEINDNDDDDYNKAQQCDSSEGNTERTSLGGSVRCGFKSYSEKFLAEQEADKQNTLLQLTNGADGDGAGHLLQLTNGEVLSAVDEGTLESSKASVGSDRKGVYGGGVRYFTSDNNNDDESEDDHSSDEEETFEEEDESEDEVEEDTDEDESGVYQEYGEEEEEEEQEEILEVEGSMGSLFSSEDSFRDDRSAGVDSKSGSSTLSSGYPAPLQRKGTYREPPQAPINDESVAS